MQTQHALQEIQYNIEHKDLIKAQLVMDHFTQIDPTEQKEILKALYTAGDEFSIQVLSYLLVKDEECSDEIRYEILTNLGLLGNPSAIEAISEFLYVDNFEIIVAAIRAMGKIGTAEAIQHLSGFMGKDLKTDLIVLDVFASQQNEISLLKLNEALNAKSAQIRNHARVRLVSIGAKVIPILIDNLFGKDVDLQIISLNILQEIGDESAAKAVRKLINQKPSEPNVRFAAYETLANISVRKGDYVLANGLTDPDNSVRIAATKAIDGNLDPSLTNGVLNIFESSESEAEWISKAVIDTQAGNLFKGLMNSEKFINKATNYLSGDIDKDIKAFFVQLLKQEGKTELADEILLQTQKEKTVKGRVCAVDDSKMILNIYRSIITELGYEAVLFSEPSKAIAWLMVEKPDFLCTDLNMPEITGVELIQQVRRRYSKEELPVFLVTTQDELQDNLSAKDAGVNEILQKPFNTEKIASVFKKFEKR